MIGDLLTGWVKSDEGLDEEVAAHEDDGDAYSFEDSPAQLVVVVILLSFIQPVEGRFRICRLQLWLHLLYVIDYQWLLEVVSFALFAPLTPLVLLTSFTSFALITGDLLFGLPLPCQHSTFLLSHQVQSNQFLTKKPIKIRISFKIPPLTLKGILPPDIFRVTPASVTGFLTIHEADSSQDETTNIPGGSPGFLVVIGKGSADGEVDFEATGGSVEVEFGCGEGVVFMELEESVVEAAGVGSIQVMEAEVEVEVSVTSDQGVGDGLSGQTRLLFHQALIGQFATFAHRQQELNYIRGLKASYQLYAVWGRWGRQGWE